MQAGEAVADHALPLLHGAPGITAGIGRLAGIAGHLQDGALQLAEGITDLRGVAGLALGAAVQAVAEVGQGAAAAGHLLGVTANGADQIDQVQAQAIEGFFDVAQLAGLRLQLHLAAEVAGGPGRQRRHQAMEDIGQAPLDGVDGQGDQQDQANHQPLQQLHLALDLPVLAAHLRLDGGQRLLQGTDLGLGAAGQLLALLDQCLGALQFAGVAL